MQHRIAYGNGQVSEGMSRKAAQAELTRIQENDTYGGFAYIQKQDQQTGEWFRTALDGAR